MDLKQWLILMTGIAGILLVVLCPRWVYPPLRLMLHERNVGFRFITQPPQSVQVVNEENGHRYFYDEWIAPRIDRADLSARIVLIIGITVWGLWIVQKLPRIEPRRKHWILIILAISCFFLAVDIHTAGNTFGK
jgi:hypothetical protein